MIRSASILLAACALLATAAHGALFRCGNVFQDRPCDGSAAVAPVAQPAPAQPAAAAPATPVPGAAGGSQFAIACARTGEFAQKVQWQREGGATQERQLADLPAARRAELAAVVQSVYARRGSAPEIRAAVEAECVQRNEQAAAAAAQLRVLTQQAGSAAPALTGADSPAVSAKPASSQASAAAGGVDRTCDTLRSQRKSLEGRMRAGGTAMAMEVLQNERRDVESQLSTAKCF